MGACSEGFSYKNPQIIDEIYAQAERAGEVEQIFLAKDEDGDLPIHKSSYYGNPTCLQWIIDKWSACAIDLDINAPDQHGFTPLYLVCWRGYLGTEALKSNSLETKEKRLECAKILINHGANINFKSPKLRMTALHWAAFQGDADLTMLLLNKGEEQHANIYGYYPVDMAGFSKHTEVVQVFCEFLRKKIQQNGSTQMENKSKVDSVLA